MNTYPEHEKLSAIKDETQFLGEFLDWLGNNNMEIAAYNHNDRLYPVNKSIQVLLAEFKNIDLNKIEVEKRAMLAALAPH
jgi:hypothetical protein